MKQQRLVIFIAACTFLGLPLIVLSGVLALPAFWLSGATAVPPGHGVPTNVHVGRTLLYISIVGVMIGLILVALAFLAGIVYLVIRPKNDD